MESVHALTKKGLGFFVVLLIIVSILCYLMLSSLESSMLYHPESQHDDSPKRHSLPFEDIQIETSDGELLHAWWMGKPDQKKTLLFFHGNAGNISHRLDRIITLGKDLPFRVLMVDYRGYGLSTGNPKEEGLYLDALASYQYLRDQGLAAKDIILFGESLGGAVAVYLASKREISHIIVESSFSCIRDMAATMFPFVPKAMVPNLFPSIDYAKGIRIPAYVIHGSRDSLIPIELGRRLFAAFPNAIELFEVPGADHNDVYIVGGSAYREKFISFVNR